MAKWRQIGGGGGEIRKWETQGDTLEGIFRGIAPGKFGDLGVLEEPDGKTVRFPVHTALQEKVAGLKEGQTVKIEYLGLHEGKSGRKYKDFMVWVDDDGSDDETPF
jgi:hypothetical protein